MRGLVHVVDTYRLGGGVRFPDSRPDRYQGSQGGSKTAAQRLSISLKSMHKSSLKKMPIYLLPFWQTGR